MKPGALLALTFNVSSAASAACSPLTGAVVDVCHCDALVLSLAPAGDGYAGSFDLAVNNS